MQFFFAVCVVIGMFHHHQAGHTIDFANKKVLEEEKCNWRRLIMEGLEKRNYQQQKEPICNQAKR